MVGILRRTMMALHVWERFNEPNDVRLLSTLVCRFVIAAHLNWLLLLCSIVSRNTNLSGSPRQSCEKSGEISRVYRSLFFLPGCSNCRIKVMFHSSSTGFYELIISAKRVRSRAVKVLTLNIACLEFSALLGNFSNTEIYIQPTIYNSSKKALNPRHLRSHANIALFLTMRRKA